MLKSALVLSCLLHVGQGRQGHTLSERADESSQVSESLAMLLLSIPASRIMPQQTRFSQVEMSERKHGGSRRAVLNGAASMATTLAATPRAVLADVRGINSQLPKNIDAINAYLKDRDFAPFEPLPFGYKPLMLVIGSRPPANIDGQKVMKRNFDGTLLVRFPHPATWVVQLPAIDSNSESGSISAVDNFKAESAAFFSERLPRGVTSLEGLDNEVLGRAVTNDIKAGFSDLKIKNKKIVKTPDGEDLLTFSTSWVIYSSAGFDIAVNGAASCFIKGKAVVGTSITYQQRRRKEMKDTAMFIAENTRIYEIPTPDDLLY